jgi:hypothetical protein
MEALREALRSGARYENHSLCWRPWGKGEET